MHQPDWVALADIHFLLYNRISDLLNTALSSIALSGMPDASEQPPEFWRSRASAKIANVLNMYTAWSYLTRYKIGEVIPERAIRPFPANTLLSWLGTQLQITPPPSIPSNPVLHANQETLQEALWLLYSVAYTQGSGVRLDLETSRLGTWFRVRFTRTTPLPGTVDDLLASFGDYWRAQDTAFELSTARDFIRLNGSDLVLAAGDGYGEFGFFVRAAGARGKTKPLNPAVLSQTAVSDAPHSTPVTPPATQTTVQSVVKPVPDDATPIFPEAQITGPITPSIPAILRPLPPLPRTAPFILRKTGPLSAVEGAATPADAETAKPDANAPAADKTIPDAPVETEPPAQAAASGEPASPPAPASGPGETISPPAPVIVALKIPAPQPPQRMVLPPASTSTTTGTVRETQTLSPVTPDSSEKPTPPADDLNKPSDPADTQQQEEK